MARECFETDNREILIEGTLSDERFFCHYLYASGNFRPPGFSRQLTVRMTDSPPHLIISGVKGEMPVVWLPDCREIESLSRPVNHRDDKDLPLLLDSCRLWRKNGPLARRRVSADQDLKGG